MTIAIFKELAEFNYGGLTFKAVSCCSVLCMDLMSNPDAEGAQALRQDVGALMKAIRAKAHKC